MTWRNLITTLDTGRTRTWRLPRFSALYIACGWGGGGMEGRSAMLFPNPRKYKCRAEMALGHGRLTPTASPYTASRRRDTHLEGVIENADANHGGLFVDLRVLRERKRAAERAGSKTRSRRKNPAPRKRKGFARDSRKRKRKRRGSHALGKRATKTRHVLLRVYGENQFKK